MKRFLKISALCLCMVLLLSCFAACSEGADNEVSFRSLKENLGGTVRQTNKGAVMDSSSRTPSAAVTLPEAIDLNYRGIFCLTLENTSDAEKLIVDFVTEADPNYTPFKRFELPLEKTDGFQKLTVDVSAVYGWLGYLTGLKITAEGLSQGEITLKTLSVEEGGEGYIDGLKIENAQVYLTAKDRMNVKRISFGPDGIVGSWRNDDGTINYIGSSSAGGVSGAFVSTGTPDDPFATMRYAGRRVNGVDWTELGYCSIAQVVKEPTTGMLIGITHLERHYDGSAYTATIGLSTSKDNGESWYFLGEFISHDIPVGEQLSVSRDIGNGTIYVDDEYLYIYIVDIRETDLAYGLAVCRVKLTELYEKTLAGEMPQAYKYKDGQWNEPGWGGSFTNVLPQDVAPNFLYVTYNTKLQKYLMLICQSPYYQSNDGDILLLASDSFTDWSNAQRQWIATGFHGEQYPSIFSYEEDCQTESGETFYLYWCDWNARDDSGVSDWQLLWATAQYMCCKVTVTE